MSRNWAPAVPAAQQPNSPTAHYYSAVTVAHSSRPSPASLLAARRGRPAAAFRFAAVGVAALAAGAPIALALGAFSLLPASAHASPRAAKPNTKRPPNVVLAQVPWKRLANHPVKEFVPLATLPWKRYFTHPVPEFVPLATLPWANCHVVPLYMPYRPEKTKKWVDPDYNFIMAMCRDQQGNLWFATEGAGVYRYAPAAPKGQRWTQFTKQNTHGGLANNCIYAIACDNHNRIWAGELNHGVSVFNGKTWQDYDIVQNPKHHVLAGPLGNHVFAMKFDRYTDQMWIGTNAGLTVYQCGKTLRAKNKTTSRAARNGVRSRSQTSRAVYPLGMNAITLSSAIDPSARRVADRGRPHTRHHWHYITQANGLPMNPDAIAFGGGGTVYVGTQCGGLAVGTQRRGTPSNALGWNRYQWTVIKGPWHMPLTATGKGLPSNLINAVAVESGGRVVVGTDGGIAFGPSTTDATPAALAVPSPASLLAAPRRAANNLRHSMQRAPRWASQWSFEHGRNFVAKVYGLWHPPVHWMPPSGQTLEQLPTEDHTTVAAWQPNPADGANAGYLWLGHWRAGLDVWQYNAAGKIIQRWHIHEPQVGNYVESLQPLKGGAMAVGCYGRGAFIITLPGESKNAWRKGADGTVAGINGNNAIVPSEPRAARPPSARELTAMANAIRTQLINAKGQKQPRIVPLPDDWRTQGSWLGNYGKYWMCLFGCCGAGDYIWRTGRDPVLTGVALGPHRRAGDAARYWVTATESANSGAMELSEPYFIGQLLAGEVSDTAPRRDSEMDDHGEAYPITWQGPGLSLIINVPRGPFVLSLYDWNDNAHSGQPARRDYIVSALALPVRGRDDFQPATSIARAAWATPAHAIGRLSGFNRGVWERFLLRGPRTVLIRLQRNYSFNTTLFGAALDRETPFPRPYFGTAGRIPCRRLTAGRTVAGSPRFHDIGGFSAARDSVVPNAEHQFYNVNALRFVQAKGIGNCPADAAVSARLDYWTCRFAAFDRALALMGCQAPLALEEAMRWVQYSGAPARPEVIRAFMAREVEKK